MAAEARLWQIPKVLAASFEKARAHIEGSDAQVVGMPYARYLEINWAETMGKGMFG